MKLCQRLWLSNKLTYILSILLWKTTQAQAQAHKFKTRNLCIHQRGLLVCVRMRAQAHIYIYTHKRTSAPEYARTYTEVHIHKYTGVCTHTHTQMCTCTHAWVCSHRTSTHKCALVRVYTEARRAQVRVCTKALTKALTWMNMHPQMFSHAHLHMCWSTHTHVLTHTNMHKCAPAPSALP